MLRYVVRRYKDGKEPPWWLLFVLYGAAGLMICLLPPYGVMIWWRWCTLYIGSLVLLMIGWWLLRRYGY